MKHLTKSLVNFPNSLNAHPFCTNGSAGRLGGLADVPLYGALSRLGGEPKDQIGWGRLRSEAFAGRFGMRALLNVGHGTAFQSILAPVWRHSFRHTH